mgnify:CR=1 FL=1
MSGDEPFYWRMAASPSGPHAFPYAYRVGVPWVVHALPFSHAFSFAALALGCIAASAAVLYRLLESFDIGGPLAAGLAIGFAFSPTLLVVLVRHGRAIDPESILIMTLGALLIVRRQRVALAVTLLVGMAVKETALYLIPLAYAVWARRPLDPQALRDVALTAAAPIAGYLVLRSAIDAVGNAYTPEYTGSFLRVRLDVIRQALSGVELRRLAYTYGPIWLIAPFALRDLRFARCGLVLLALCLGSMAFSFDIGRIIFLAAPVFYVAVAWVLRSRPRLALAAVIALLAMDAGYAIYLQAYGTRHGLDGVAGHASSGY